MLTDLEFDSRDEAEGLLATMKQVWAGPGQDVMQGPQARIVEVAERIESK